MSSGGKRKHSMKGSSPSIETEKQKKRHKHSPCIGSTNTVKKNSSVRNRHKVRQRSVLDPSTSAEGGGKRKYSMKDSSPSVETEKQKKLRKHSPCIGSTNTAKKNSSVRNRHKVRQRSVLDPSTSAEGGPYETNNSTRFRCPICFETARNNRMKSLSCYHAFHQVCIDKWLHEYKECPVCGQEEEPQNTTPSLNNTDAYQCSICLEPARNNEMKSLSCYHAFHQTCIDTWLHDHRECPVCRLEEAPPQNFIPSNNQGDSISRRYECPICLELTRNNEMMSLSCYHAFHQACIHTWLREHRECPVCQQEVPPEITSPSHNQTASHPSHSHNQTASNPSPLNNQAASNPSPSSNNQGTGNSAEYQCCICFEPARNNEMKSLPCYHAFHEACIDEWLIRNRRCPVCRHETEPSQNARSPLNNQEQASSRESQTLHGRTSIRNSTRRNNGGMSLMINNLITTLTNNGVEVQRTDSSSVIRNRRCHGCRGVRGRTTIMNHGHILMNDDGNVTILNLGNTGRSMFFSL